MNGNNVIHLVMRDDVTQEDAWIYASQIAETHRFATGEIHVTTNDDWMVCAGRRFDPDHDCYPEWDDLEENAGPPGPGTGRDPVRENHHHTGGPADPSVSPTGDTVGVEGFPAGSDEWATQ